MKRTFIFIVIIVVIIATGLLYQQLLRHKLAEKVYVAVEGENKIVALNPLTGDLLATIALSTEHDGGWLPYAPHNVQVSPDNQTVWVTANSGQHQNHTSHLLPTVYAHGEAGEGADEVIVINPDNDQITKRIPLGEGLHLAHVVLTPDNTYALVTAQTEGAIYKINTQTYEVADKIVVPGKQEPHGLRLSPDGLTAYIAMLAGKNLGLLDLRTNTLSLTPLGGAAVQTGITPDGQFAVASLYDTKQLAVYYTSTGQIRYIQLPPTARGPVQMFATPDSRFIYVADQGYYFGQPTSEWVYKIDTQIWHVVKEIKAGEGPHGVAASPDGKRIYVTNLISGDVSIIDTATDQETSRVQVGSQPNGVSVWTNNQ